VELHRNLNLMTMSSETHIYVTISNRLQEQLVAELRIQEGDLGTERRSDFFTFFINTIDKVVKNISDSEEKRKAREILCAIFQVSID